MCSCLFLPPCWMKTVWSTPASENLRRWARSWSGVPMPSPPPPRKSSDFGAHRRLDRFVLLPDVRAAGLVRAEGVVVAEAELEELEAIEAAAERLVGVFVAGEAGDHGDVRVDGVADRHAFVLERLVVVGHPVLRFFRVDEGEGEGADAELGGEVDRVAVRTCDPERRVRLLDGLRHDVAHRHREVLALESRVGVHGEHVRDLLDGLAPHRAALHGVDVEAFEFGAGGGFAGAELDAAVGDEVERGDFLGDTRGGVVARAA